MTLWIVILYLYAGLVQAEYCVSCLPQHTRDRMGRQKAGYTIAYLSVVLAWVVIMPYWTITNNLRRKK